MSNTSKKSEDTESNKFYFIIDGVKKGPFFSCPDLQKYITKDYNFARYLDKIQKSKQKLLPYEKKLINDIFKNKKPAKHPTCYYLISVFQDEPKIKQFNNDETIVISFHSIAEYIEELSNNEEIINQARKNPENFSDINDFIGCCSELKSRLFVTVLLHAAKNKFSICVYNGYYSEIFDLIFKIFKDFNYEQFELYNIQFEETNVNNYVENNFPEKKNVKYIYTSTNNIFYYIINKHGFMINKNKKILECLVDLNNCKEITGGNNLITGGNKLTTRRSKSRARSKSRSSSKTKSRSSSKTKSRPTNGIKPSIQILINKNKKNIIKNLF
jgi:hypothetical protein